VIRPPRFDSRLAEIAARLGAAGLADQARVIVEKPFGRDLAGVAKLQEMPMVRTRLLGGVGSPPQSGLYPINREKFREIAPLFVAIGLSTAAQWPISTAILPYRAAWLCCKGRECKHSEQGSKSAEHRKIAVIAYVCNPASTARAARLDEFGMQSA